MNSILQWRKPFQQAALLIVLVIVFTQIAETQQDVSVRVSESVMSEVVASLVEARAVNFGDYLGNFGLEAWYVNMDGGSIDIKPQNKLRINANIVANAESDLAIIQFPVVAHANVEVDGDIELRSVATGYSLVFKPTSARIVEVTSGVPDFIIEIMTTLATYELTIYVYEHPEIELNSGTALLPDAITSYFTSPTPTLTTTETEIVLSYTVVGSRRTTIQNDVSGNNNVGDIEALEGTWNTYASPKDFWWELNSTHQVSAVPGIIPYSGEDWKFRVWQETGQYTREISVVANADQYRTAEFQPAVPVVVQTDLAGTGNGGYITIDGEVLQSPANGYAFKPTYFTPIGAPSVQTTPDGQSWSFVQWNDGITTPTRAISITSPSTYTATYRKHLTSASATATATNNQRKISQSDLGVFCLVYEENNIVWFSRSSDGISWSQDVLLSNGSAGALNTYPSIVVKGPIANVIWQSIDWWGPPLNGNGYIYLRRYNISTDTWGPLEQVAFFAPTSSDYAATPAIDAASLSADGASQELKRLVWKDTDGIKVIDNNYGTWSPIATVQGTHGNCFYPGIVNYNGDSYGICWEDASPQTIRYTESFTNGSSWSWTNAAQVSAIGWYSNQRPSIAAGYETGACTAEKVSIAWQSVDNVVEGVSVHVRQVNFGCNNWGNITSYSIGTGGYQPHPAIGSYGANGKLSLVWNIVNDVYVASYNGSCWSAPGLLAAGASGGTECSINNSTPSLLAALWRKPNGGISITTNGVNPNWKCGAEEESIAGKYSVVGDSSVVPVPYRLNRHGLVEIHRAIGSSNKSVRGTMAFEIAGMKLVTPEGVQTLEYEDLASLPNGRGELSSKPFTVSNANSQLVFAGAAYGKRLAIPEDSIRSVAQPIALVKLKEHVDGNPRAQVWRLPFSNLSTTQDSTFGEYREFTVDLAEYVGKELYVEVEMLGRARRVAPLIDDDYLILPGEMQMIVGNSFAKAVDKSLPTTYSLYQNYPNPFNPTTTIGFDLPEAQIVSLKVFNVLGQQVRELANTLYEAGEHSVVADFTNLPSGMYFYSITAGIFTDVKKLLLIR